MFEFYMFASWFFKRVFQSSFVCRFGFLVLVLGFFLFFLVVVCLKRGAVRCCWDEERGAGRVGGRFVRVAGNFC